MKEKNDYWEQREKEWISSRIKKDQSYLDKMAERYQVLIGDIEKQVNSFYSKYALDNGLSMSEAIRKVDKFDVKAFEREAKRLVESRDFSANANKQLKIYNATMKINRLEYLKAQVGLELVKVTNKEQKELDEYLNTAYLDEVKRQSGILSKHKSQEVAKKARVVASASFQGATWSDRLWINQTVLKTKLDALISRAMIQGTNPTQLVSMLRKNVAQEVKNATSVIERLVITETARVQDEATMRSFRANGFKFCKWIAEPTACKYCLEIAERRTEYGTGVYPVMDAPMIPKHPRCRCSKAAYWVDKENLAPGIFEKWFGKKEKNEPKEVFHDYPSDIDAIVKRFVSDKNVQALGEKRAKEYAYRLSKAPEQYQKLFAMYKDKVEIAGDIAKTKDSNYYDPVNKKIHLRESSFLEFPHQKGYDLVYHEVAHGIADVSNVLSGNGLGKNVKIEVVEGVEKYLAINYPELKDTKRTSNTFAISLNHGLFSKENVKKTGYIADVYGGAIDMPLQFGHYQGYYDSNHVFASEFFANTIASAINNPIAYEFQREIVPKSTEFVDNIVKEMSSRRK
ncbi:hypothetical protein [Ligilactobacillus animalis]|uniref:hypothetical protein n=1 Tax=Ligilactobacillus animalis TaxID=1605 RepID=UPI00241E9F7A|nr:hypothetical protein [Ligilactobacillus animalis]